MLLCARGRDVVLDDGILRRLLLLMPCDDLLSRQLPCGGDAGAIREARGSALVEAQKYQSAPVRGAFQCVTPVDGSRCPRCLPRRRRGVKIHQRRLAIGGQPHIDVERRRAGGA